MPKLPPVLWKPLQVFAVVCMFPAAVLFHDVFQRVGRSFWLTRKRETKTLVTLVLIRLSVMADFWVVGCCVCIVSVKSCMYRLGESFVCLSERYNCMDASCLKIWKRLGTSKDLATPVVFETFMFLRKSHVFGANLWLLRPCGGVKSVNLLCPTKSQCWVQKDGTCIVWTWERNFGT